MKITPSMLYSLPALKLLDPSHRELQPEVGSRGFTSATVKGVDEKNRRVTAVVSTPNVDRYNEIIDPKAFRKWLPRFMQNPVLIAGHTYSSPNGSPTIIGHWLDLQITKEGLIGTAQFMSNDPLAEAWWQRFAQKAARAFSVGFISHQWEMRDIETEPGTTQKLRVFTEVELIEISAVAIPANRESLVLAASAMAGARAIPGENADDAEGEDDATLSLSQRKMKAMFSKTLRPVARSVIQDELQRQLTCQYGPVATLIEDIIGLHFGPIVDYLRGQSESAATPKPGNKGIENVDAWLAAEDDDLDIDSFDDEDDGDDDELIELQLKLEERLKNGK